MDFRVAAIGRGQDIAQHALELGAHIYVDPHLENAAEKLNTMGGAKAIIATIGYGDAVSPLIGGLAPKRRLVILGTSNDPLSILPGQLVGGERAVLGSITGSPYEIERTLDFSVLTGVRPMIETMPLARAPEALQKLKSGDVKFRMMLTMG
jgi:alcohol dehydrogenase